MSEHLCGLCEIGSYEGMIELVAPSWSSKKTICVDICLAMEITNLWKVGIRTTGCCCGHGKALGYIGVWEEDIERMLELSYEVRPNETDASRRDGFYPKTEFNTRAVPDVPDLVRYTQWYGDMKAMPYGEYVLHSQAAEIIAAKADHAAKQIGEFAERMQDDVNHWKQRAEAAEAKLAQYESQEVVAWKWHVNYNNDWCWSAIKPEFSTSDLERGLVHSVTPLYASPSPAADLKAESDKLREALEFYADVHKYPSPLTGGMGDLWSDCGQIARAALNVETNNDKG